MKCLNQAVRQWSINTMCAFEHLSFDEVLENKIKNSFIYPRQVIIAIC